MPAGGARGSHAFRASRAAAPTVTNEDGEDEERENNPEDLDSTVRMLIGNPDQPSALASAPMGPATTSATTASGVTGTSSLARTTSTAASSASLPTISITDDDMAIVDSDDEANDNAGKGKRKRRAAKKTSDASGSRKMSRSTTSTSASVPMEIGPKKMNAGVAINNMQGSINCLTDAIRETMTMAEDGVILRKKEAVKRMLEIETHLTTEEQVQLMSAFNRDGGLADMYLLVDNEVLRRAWLASVISGSA